MRRYVGQELPGSGALVELGCWLGAATIAIATGLNERVGAPVKFHTFDRFRMEDQAHIFASAPDFNYEEGSSFRSLFDRRLGDLRSVTEVHEGPVEDAEWNGPIDLLFNDVSKSWATWQSVRRTFFGHLVPGSAITVEQDFGHPFTPWLILSYHRWRAYCEVLGTLQGTGTVIFRLRTRVARPRTGAERSARGVLARPGSGCLRMGRGAG